MSHSIETRSTALYWRKAWLVWIAAALFYGMEFFQRVSPSVMAKPIMHSLQINATMIGIVASLYFYAYAAAQIPVGLLLDRYGARKPLAIACLLISLGSLMFAIGKMLIILFIARILVGLGSAFAFIGTLKLISNWFPQRHYAFMVGLTNSIGVIGAIAGEQPFAHMVNHLGWQESLILISLLGFVIVALIWWWVLDRPRCKPGLCHELLTTPTKPCATQIIKDLLSSYQTWITALYAGLMVAPIIAFGELWAVPFYETAYHLSSSTAASINSAVFVGIAVGGPLNGLIAGWLQRRKLVMMIGTLMAMACLGSIVFMHQAHLWALYLLMFGFGYFTSSMLLCFAINKARFPTTHNATVVALTNMVIAIGGGVFEGIIGFLLDHIMHVSAQHYTTQDYRTALVILPGVLVFNLLLLCFIREPQQTT